MEPPFNVMYFLIDSRLSDNHYFPGNLHLRLFRIECSMIAETICMRLKIAVI
jgi:hypothetical protein